MTAKLGLALSGGGARGAYEVGVVRHLADIGIEPEVYAGASIGALNGAVLASAPSLREGAVRLEALWRSLCRGDLIKLRLSSDGILDPEPLRTLLTQHVDLEQLRRGRPLWVSLYRSGGWVSDMLTGLLAVETRDSIFLPVQSLKPEDQFRAILGSAALPGAFPAQEVNGVRYADGGLGGARRVQGNTPVTALREAGCTHGVVVHLADGSLWNRRSFSDLDVLEIRPEGEIHPEGALSTLLDFSSEAIDRWIAQGEADAARCVGPVREMLAVRREAAAARADLHERLKRLRDL